jgi:hypothetical protein
MKSPLSSLHFSKHGRLFVRKGQRASDAGRTTNLKRRAVRESERNRRQRLAREEGGKRREVR